MFIGQGQSLDARRAAQAERRAANAAVVMAASAAERPSSESLPPSEPLVLSPPGKLLTSNVECTVSLLSLSMDAAPSLPITAPSATVAAATTAAPCLPAAGTSLAMPHCAAQPDDLVPRKFPGGKGIMCPNMIPFLLVIYSLMDTI